VTGALRRALMMTLRFLSSFFIDDNPEVLVVVLVIVGVACALRDQGGISVIVLPILAIVGLGLCVWHASRPRTNVQSDNT